MVKSRRSVNLTTFFLGRLRPSKRLTRTLCTFFRDNCPSLVNGDRNKSMWSDRISNPGPLALESDVSQQKYLLQKCHIGKVSHRLLEGMFKHVTGS